MFSLKNVDFDDASYTGARLLEIVSQQEKNIGDIFATLPHAIATSEINISMVDDKNLYSPRQASGNTS